MQKYDNIYVWLRCLALLILLVVSVIQTGALAALSTHGGENKNYRSQVSVPEEEPLVIVVKQDLAEFLMLAAKYNGYQVKFSNEVTGVLENVSLPMNIHQILPKLGKSFDLAWHIRSSMIFVSDSDVQSEKLLELRGLQLDVLKDAILQSGIGKEDFEMTILGDRNFVHLKGPASYLDSITHIAGELSDSIVRGK